MGFQTWRRWRITGLSSLLLFGCESGGGHPSYPDDPLLLDKKPSESQVENAAPPLLVQAEPTPPAMPPQALAPTLERPPAQLAETVKPGQSAAQPAVGAGQGLVEATPTSRARSLPAAPSLPPMRRQVPETYGHAADYSWLQGVLAKPAQGPATLRFHENPSEDKWRGQVSLGEEPFLKPFGDGDQVLVEGELLADQSDGTQPCYRVRAIWLVHRAAAARQ